MTASSFTLMGSGNPLSYLAMEAGRALAGEVDGNIKQRKLESTVSSPSSSSSPPGISSSSSAAPRRSPLARILVSRLNEAHSLLIQSGTSLPTEMRQLAAASEEQLHLLTAQTALLCLEMIHRGEDSQPRTLDSDQETIVGAKDRKTIRTLLSLISSWGLEPTLLSYDGALDALTKSHSTALPRLQELSEERAHNAIVRQAFQLHHKQLIDLFRGTCSLLKSHHSPARPLMSHGFIATQLLDPHQPIAAHLLAAVLRLTRGPQFHAPGSDAPSETFHEANACLSFMLKCLPPTTLLPLLSSVSSPRSTLSPGGTPLPAIPPPIRNFATRLLSAQLLRREGIVVLISSVMKLGEDPSEEQASSTIRLDRLATLLTMPPPGMDKDLFLAQHILPALMSFIDPNSPDGQASTVFAKVTSYTLEKLVTHGDEGPVRTALEPLIWSAFLPEVSHRTMSSTALPSSRQLGDALSVLEVLLLYSTSVSSLWIDWLIQPIVFRLWDLLGVLERGPKEKVADIRKSNAAVTQLDQVKTIIQKWLERSEAQEIMRIVRSCVAEQSFDESRVYFELDESGKTAIKFGKPSPQTADIASLLSNVSVSAQPVSNESEARALLPHLQSLASSQTGPSAPLLTALLSRAGRSDLASALLPDLLELYLSEKARSTTQAWYLLQVIVEMLDTFGDMVTKHKQETNNVLKFVNVCLGGQTSVSPAIEEKVEQAGDLPFIAMKGHGSDAMAELLGTGRASQEGVAESAPDLEEEELDEGLIKTAVDLLLSVLEGNPELSSSTSPLLRLIGSKLPLYLSPNIDEDLRRVVKEARLVLFAREQANRLDGGVEDLPHLEPLSRASRRAAQAKYEEALKLLQDPILPVRAHGLVLLKEIVAAKEHTGASEHLLPPILDIVLNAVGDEESYLYLNAVSTLKEVVMRGEPYLSRVLGQYARGDCDASREAIDERLRIGEALLAAIQHWSEGGAVYLDLLLPALLSTLRDKRNSATLKSSALSLLGTCVEAFPLALASATRQNYVAEMVRGCLDLLQLEMVRRSGRGRSSRSTSAGAPDVASDNEREEEAKEEDTMQQKRRLRFAPGADDSTSLDSSYPQLRRGALLLLHLLVKGTRDQLTLFVDEHQQSSGKEETTLHRLRLPGGGLLPSTGTVSSSSPHPPSLPPFLFPLPTEADQAGLHQSARDTFDYLAREDDDALVRRMAEEVAQEMEALKVDSINVSLLALQ